MRCCPYLKGQAATTDVVLLRVIGNVLLELEEEVFLEQILTTLPLLNDNEAQAERYRQQSRALFQLGRQDEALAAARTARETRPQAAHYSEYLARLLLETGEPVAAVKETNMALHLAARNGNPQLRARLYVLLGKAEEARGEFDRAYDAYQRATRLVPEYAPATRNLERLRTPGD